MLVQWPNISNFKNKKIMTIQIYGKKGKKHWHMQNTNKQFARLKNEEY
jgi:hypothetical protein